RRSLDQKGAHDVVRRTNHPLILVVLRRGIRTRHAQLNTPREEERTGGGVVELPPIVTLDGLNGVAELSGHPGKVVECGEGLRLGAQRKRPRVVREVVDHHQIVLITRKAKYRRGPQVTVNKLKCMRRMRRRRRKREPNMTTELARMVEGLSRSPSTRNIGTTTDLSQNIAARVTKMAVAGGGRRHR